MERENKKHPTYSKKRKSKKEKVLKVFLQLNMS
jgi:hypothetical protein